MDAVTLAAANAAAKKNYVSRSGPYPIRVRDLPGAAGIPTVNTGLGTAVVSAANAASGITNKTSPPITRTNFRPFGVEPKFGTTFPDSNGWLGLVYTRTSAPPWALEFDLDSVGGVFELSTKGNGAKVRILVNGQLLQASPIALPNDGNVYLVTTTLTGGAGQYRIRIEGDSSFRFYGINMGPTDGVTAAPRRGPRVAALGDSFWEPTISDPGSYMAWQGLPGMLAYVTGWDVFACGSGGTGLVNPGPNGRVKYADRLAEVLAIPGLDVLLVPLSSNDSAYTAAQVVPQAQAIITAAKAGGLTGYGQIMFLSPWWSSGPQAIPSSILAHNDAVKALCAQQGVVFIENLTPPVVDAVSTTFAASTAAGAFSVQSTAAIPSGAWVKFGSEGKAEVRQLNGSSGSGPYTITFNGAAPFVNAHAAGEPIVQVDAAELTGTGRMGSPANNGTADRYTGPDGTHNSIAGAMFRAKRIASRVASTLPR